MKKLILFIAAVAICHTTVFSQGCLPEGITFTTQEQIDNFPINYPGCTEIEGKVSIWGQWDVNITNLNGFIALTSIGGNLSIDGCNALTNLTGLNNVTSIGGSLILGGDPIWGAGNDSLTSLTGLDGLTSIEGGISIANNNCLTSLTGLENLNTIGGELRIFWNDSLTNLIGLENLTSIGGYLELSFNTLTSLTGLENVTSIGGIDIFYTYSLSSLIGLDNVTFIGGDLSLSANQSLTSLTGLENVTSIGGGLSIGSNFALSSIAGLENVTSIGGNLGIYGSSLTSLTGLEGLTSIGGSLGISGNGVLSNINGLENIAAGSIAGLNVSSNSTLSSCHVQSICDYLAAPNSVVDIVGNAAGCNSPLEVASNCGITLSCLPYGNYYFLSQGDIDNFANNFPGCTALMGNVTIEGTDISNLSGLGMVTSIGGDLIIGNGVSNSSLTSLEGLESLTSIGGNLIIGSQNGISNFSLINLEGLGSLTSIGGYLAVLYNAILENLTGLENVTSIGGDLEIGYNNSLISLAGLDNIDAGSITDLWIYNNTSLSTCEVESVCNYLAAPGGIIDIVSNEPGCNSPEEVEEACNQVSIESIGFEDTFLLFPNPAGKTVTISGNNATAIQEIFIYNLTGQKVQQGKPVNNTLDISKLQPGMYIIELITNQGKVREKLVVE